MLFMLKEANTCVKSIILYDNEGCENICILDI